MMGLFSVIGYVGFIILYLSVSARVSYKTRQFDVCIRSVTEMNDLLRKWDVNKIGVSNRKTAEALIVEKLFELALAVITQEKFRMSSGEERVEYCSARELAFNLGLSNGDMTPHFVWAERKWNRLAAEGKVPTDYQI